MQTQDFFNYKFLYKPARKLLFMTHDGTVSKPFGRWFVLSLSLAVFGTSMLDVLASLFLIDIAMTFLGDSSLPSIAIVSQIVTISTLVSVVFGVLSGFLSVKVNHKKLLLFGALCVVVGTVGCFLAPSFLFMQIFFPLDGIGTIVVNAMALTMIGESLPLEDRGRSVGYVRTAGLLSSAIGFALAGYIAAVGGWRSYLLWYVLPISLLALGLAYFVIPSTRRSIAIPTEMSYLASFKNVLLKRSALACLFGTLLIVAASVWGFFGATFWRTQFLMSLENAGLISLLIICVYAAGCFAGGQLVDRSGRKRLVVTSWMGRGLLISVIAFIPSFWGALVITCFATFIGGIAMTAGSSLNLEQAPRSRGTMMSMAGVFGSIGASLGFAVGSIALGTSGFQLLGLIFGAFGVSSAVVVFFFAGEQTKLQGTD